MKVLWHDKDYRVPMYDWVKYHILNELRLHGVEVDYFDILRYSDPQKANESLIKQIKKVRYDIFITAFNEYDIGIKTIKEIKKEGVAAVLICFDNLVVPYRHKNVAPYFDLVWLTSLETEWMFKKWGCKTIFLPYAANPNLIRFRGIEIAGVGFVGTPYGSRANMINALVKNDINLYCYYKHSQKKKVDTEGIPERKIKYENKYREKSTYVFRKMLGYKEGRKIIKGALVNKCMPSSKIDTASFFFHEEFMVPPQEVYIPYSRHTLSLSSTTARNTGVLKKPLYIVNLRSFEIPMAGGIQFCQYNSELAGYFEPDKEIVFFEDNNDMIEKAKFYLDVKNEGLAKKIKVNARKRAEGEHTWFHRFERIFKELDIPIKEGIGR